MDAMESEPGSSSNQLTVRSVELPIITITPQDIDEDSIGMEHIPSFTVKKAKQCCTLFLWTGKHQKCCKFHPKNRRKTANISMIWIYFVLLMLFLCLFFVIFLSVIKGGF